MESNPLFQSVSGVSIGVAYAWIVAFGAILAGLIFILSRIYKWAEKYRSTRNKLDHSKTAMEQVEQETKEQAKDIHALENALCWMMADRLNQKIKHYYRIGYIPADEFSELAHMHEAYKMVGGNSTIDEKYEKCKSDLKVRAEDSILSSYLCDNCNKQNDRKEG